MMMKLNLNKKNKIILNKYKKISKLIIVLYRKIINMKKKIKFKNFNYLK